MFLSSLRWLTGHLSPKTRRPRRSPGHSRKVAPRVRLELEPLEVRIVPTTPGDWSMYNHDLVGSRTNSAETTLVPGNAGGLQVLWNFPTAGQVTGTPAVVDNVAYFGDTAGEVFALTSGGQQLWKTQVDGPVTDSLLITGHTAVFGTLNGSIYGLSTDTGAVLWRTRPELNTPMDPWTQIWGSATPVGNNVAIGVTGGGEENVSDLNHVYVSRGALVLLNPTNGNMLWQTYTITNAEYAQGASGASIWTTPAYDPAGNGGRGVLYAGTGNNFGNGTQPTSSMSDAIVAFDATDGHILWANQRTASDEWNGNFPVGSDFDFADSSHLYQLANGTKVVGEGQKSGFFHVLNATTGSVLTQIQPVPGGSDGGLFATAAVDGGVVFANARHPHPGQPDTGDLVAIAGDGSHILWDFPTPAPDISGVAVANGVVYFQSTDGTLYALSEATGTVLAQITTGGWASGPAISNGRLYLGLGYYDTSTVSPGGLIALGVASPPTVWNAAAPLPLQRHEVQTAVVNGRMYLFGGFDAANDTTTEVDMYNPVTNTWTRLHDMPIPLTHAGVAVDGQTVYLAGGWYGTNPGVITNRVLKYDAATDTWSDAPPLPQARGSGALVILGRQLHFFSGIDAPEFDGNDQADHWVLNLDGGTGWTSAAPLPTPRFHMGYVALNGKAYAIGGESQHGSGVLAEVDAYDPATNTWTTVAPLPMPMAHIDDATFVLNGQIVTVGGSAADGSPLANVMAYDPTTNTWTVLTSLPEPLSGTAAQQINGEVIVAGGSPPDSTDTPATWTAFFNPPRITSANSTTFTVGTSGSFTITTAGSPTASITESGTLPAGVSFQDNGDGTATLSGTPVTGGRYSLTLTAHNGTGSDATQTFTLTVNPSTLTPTTTTVRSSVSSSVYGQAVTLTATVGLAPPNGETVTFTIDGVAQTPVVLAGGQASFTTTALIQVPGDSVPFLS